ncbi:MAG TPA: SUMF1/EgtB/PvdO family nonheme iron enzyme [Pyrinomonadaceae bacterium]|nr:SUMF1/EgtB/PvdO family nonheme iron enzyme [Pyrinomonadaceae bacterium]
MSGHKVFVSYKSVDREWCRNLAQRLRENDVDAWWDEWEIKYGDSILGKMDEGIDQSEFMLLVLSPESVGADAHWVGAEWQGFLSGVYSGKRKGQLIPILLRDTDLPAPLARLKYLDFRDGSKFEEQLLKLVNQIKGVEARPPLRPAPQPLEFTAEVAAGEFAVLLPRREILVAGTRFNYVPAGEFLMGSGDGYEQEQPRHKVRVGSFFMAVAPVTNLQFDSFVRATGYVTTAEVRGGLYSPQPGVWDTQPGVDWRHPSGPDSTHRGKEHHPVVQVSWYDARKYCEWLSGQSGVECDLPTEAQWEYAASGPSSNVWAFGDSYRRGLANLEGRDTTSVADYAPNAFGLYDMAGNVHEWCSDWFAETWALAGHDLGGVTSNPAGPAQGKERVLKGGSWFDEPKHARNANRFSAGASLSAPNWGFRCSLALGDELLDRLHDAKVWGLKARQMYG